MLRALVVVGAVRIGLKESFLQISRRLLFKTEAHGMLVPRKANWVLVNIIESFRINGIFTANRLPFGLFIELVRLNIRRLAY